MSPTSVAMRAQSIETQPSRTVRLARMAFDRGIPNRVMRPLRAARALGPLRLHEELLLLTVELDVALAARDNPVATERLAELRRVGSHAGPSWKRTTALFEARVAARCGRMQQAFEIVGDLFADPDLEMDVEVGAQLVLADLLMAISEPQFALEHYEIVRDHQAATTRQLLEATTQLGLIAAASGDFATASGIEADLRERIPFARAAQPFAELVASARSGAQRNRSADELEFGQRSLRGFIGRRDSTWALRAAVAVAKAEGQPTVIFESDFTAADVAHVVGFDALMDLAATLLEQPDRQGREDAALREFLYQAVEIAGRTLSPLVVFESRARALHLELVRAARSAEKEAQDALDRELNYQRVLVDLTTNELRGLLTSLSFCSYQPDDGASPAQVARFDALVSRVSALTVRLDLFSDEFNAMTVPTTDMDLSRMLKDEASGVATLASEIGVDVVVTDTSPQNIRLNERLTVALVNWLLAAGADAAAPGGRVEVRTAAGVDDRNVLLEVTVSPIRTDLAGRPNDAWMQAAELVLSGTDGGIERTTEGSTLHLTCAIPRSVDHE